MPGHKEETGQFVTKYIEANPKLTNTEIARLLHKVNPNLFPSVEKARSSVRYYRGVSGISRAQVLADKSLSKQYMEIHNPFRLPESYIEVAKEFHFPKYLKKLLILTDLHIPYHSIESLTLAMEYAQKEGVDAILLNGDILDFYQVSDHEKNPSKCSIKMEIELAKEFFNSLREAFPTQYICFAAGNHENRLKRYLWKNAKQIFDIDEFRLEKLLCLDAFDIKFLGHMGVNFWGKLLIEHGDKLRCSGGVSPARTLLLKFKRSVACGHFHRPNSAHSVVYKGETHVAYSIGCMCELNPDYLPVNEWVHGFAIVEKDEDGSFSFSNKQILDGKIYG